MIKPIAVLGAGAWGTALAVVLALNGNSVRLWGNNPEHIDDLNKKHINFNYLPNICLPENIECYSDLKQTLADIQDIFIAVPSVGFRHLLEQIKRIKDKEIRIGWGTKGMDPGSRLLLSQVAAEVFPNVPLAILAGPSFAKEIAEKIPTAVSMAGNNELFIDDLIKRFNSTYFRVYKNSDFIGVQVCGVIKNIIAIGVGVADGLHFGANTRAALITRGLAEMSRFVVAMGGEAKTSSTLAGVGDLVLTCTDNQSRNRRFGLALALEKRVEVALQAIGHSVEGYNNARQVYDLARSLHVDMPITHQVYRMLFENVMVEDAVNALLMRIPGHE